MFFLSFWLAGWYAQWHLSTLHPIGSKMCREDGTEFGFSFDGLIVLRFYYSSSQSRMQERRGCVVFSRSKLRRIGGHGYKIEVMDEKKKK